MLLAILFLAGGAWAQDSNNCYGSPNTLPMVTSAPVFVEQVEHGSSFVIGKGELDVPINVVVLDGSPYEMGYALGQLMQDPIQFMLAQVWVWVDALLEPVIGTLPQGLQQLIEEDGVPAALDWQWKQVQDYTPQRFVDEMKGIADGAKVDYQDVVRVAMIPELTQAACSMFGAWDDASADNESLVVLRALDWDTNGPFQQYPLITVYQPDASTGGHPFSTIGWPGLTGAIAGYSPEMAVCEKVWLHYNGTYTHSGYPWTFLLRDILQYDSDTTAAMSRIDNAERTCSIFVGLGDGSEGTFSVAEYSHDYVVWPYEYEGTNHTWWPNLPFVDKHTQPSTDPCLNALLTENYGKITPALTQSAITSVFQTGDMLVAIYDYAENAIYVANAGPAPSDYEGDGEPAYNRILTRVDMGSLGLKASGNFKVNKPPSQK